MNNPSVLFTSSFPKIIDINGTNNAMLRSSVILLRVIAKINNTALTWLLRLIELNSFLIKA